MKLLTSVFLAVLLSVPAFASSRVWTATNGKTTEAELIGKTSTTVRLKRSIDDVVLEVPIASLSTEDKTVVAEYQSEGTANVSDLETVLKGNVARMTKAEIELAITNQKAGTTPRYKVSQVEYIGLLGNPSDAKHSGAWAFLRATKLNASVKSMRDQVAALPQTAETRTLIGRVLDPALVSISVGLKNPSGVTQQNIADLARLHAALSVK